MNRGEHETSTWNCTVHPVLLCCCCCCCFVCVCCCFFVVVVVVFVCVCVCFVVVFNNCIVPFASLTREIRVAFPEERQLRLCRATQSTVHSGWFSVSIIHQPLTRTTGSLTCAQMSMHTIVHVGVGHRKRVCTGESNLPQRRAGPTLYQLSYIPIYS